MDFLFFFPNDDRLSLLGSTQGTHPLTRGSEYRRTHTSLRESPSTVLHSVLRLKLEKVLDGQLTLKRGGRTLPHGRVNSLSGDTSPRWTPAASARPAHGPWISPARSEQQRTTAETALAKQTTRKPHLSLSLLFMATLLVSRWNQWVCKVQTMHSAGTGTCTFVKDMMPSHCSSLFLLLDVLFLFLFKWLCVC